MRLIRKLIRDERGATAIEYGLIGSLVSVAIIVGATTLGTRLNLVYDSVATALQNIAPGAGASEPPG